jgi:outer membrane protein
LQHITFAALKKRIKAGMKQLNTIITAILALAVAVLFYLQFKGQAKPQKALPSSGSDSSFVSDEGRIAYFEMDSVEQQYLYIKDVQNKLKARERTMRGELEGMRNGYMGRIQQLQSKAATMSQQEGEAAQAEINQMERNMQQKEAKLAQELQEEQFKLMQDINQRIEGFLTEYNADKGFSYIISRQSGDFIYFKDTTLNITNEVVKGLNARYESEKGAKKEETKKN